MDRAPNSRTLQSAWEALGVAGAIGGWVWPPDVFAFTSAVLEDSGVYRFAVSPPAPSTWPPDSSWGTVVAEEAAAWRKAVDTSSTPTAPASIVARLEEIASLGTTTIVDLDKHWEACSKILSLHAIADEACDAIGVSPVSRRYGEASLLFSKARRLLEGGSLSTASLDVARVLPKLRTPQVGIALRSLSRSLSFHRSEVQPTWMTGPAILPDQSSVNLLVIPWPMRFVASDFREVAGHLTNMDQGRFGFFTIDPQEAFPTLLLRDLVEAAKRHSGRVPDAVVLPESSVTSAELVGIERELERLGVRVIVAGVRSAADDRVAGENSAQVRINFHGKWTKYEQPKHHRWAIDERQNRQYDLSSSLSAGRTWWEAIKIPPRTVHFARLNDWFTVCPLVCEDLARQDPVAGILRAVGPTLVVGLLMDGPQLSERWAARYATVLADDPGSSVLTVTSLGMSLRSRVEGKPASRVIACWKDGKHGLRQIEVPEGSEGVLLSVYPEWIPELVADGRATDTVAPRLVLSGVAPLTAQRLTKPTPHVRKPRNKRKK